MKRFQGGLRRLRRRLGRESRLASEHSHLGVDLRLRPLRHLPHVDQRGESEKGSKRGGAAVRTNLPHVDQRGESESQRI